MPDPLPADEAADPAEERIAAHLNKYEVESLRASKSALAAKVKRLEDRCTVLAGGYDPAGLRAGWAKATAERDELRATVARLRTAAGDYLAVKDARLDVIREAGSPAAYYAAEGAEKNAETALRAALDDTTEEPHERLARVLDQVDARVVFWCCPFDDHRGVEWRTHEDQSMTPMCKTCGRIGPTYPPSADDTTAGAPEPTRQPLAEGPTVHPVLQTGGSLVHQWVDTPPGTVVQVFAAAPQEHTDG